MENKLWDLLLSIIFSAGSLSDVSEMIHALQSQAKRGAADVPYLLALMYHHGHGVPQDFAQAVK